MKVVAIVYEGSSIPTQVAMERVKDMLGVYVNNSSAVVVKQYDEEDLLNMGVHSSINSISKTSKEEAIEHSINYIVGKLHDTFGSEVQFTLGLLEVLNSPEKEMLKKAINIIYDNRDSIEVKTMKAMGIPIKIFSAIISFKRNYDV